MRVLSMQAVISLVQVHTLPIRALLGVHCVHNVSVELVIVSFSKQCSCFIA